MLREGGINSLLFWPSPPQLFNENKFTVLRPREQLQQSAEYATKPTHGGYYDEQKTQAAHLGGFHA
jgi:hypothetical protein